MALVHAPAPGRYPLSDASATLTSGRPDPDAFGLSMVAGDIDGDGLGDLVIGAPRDATVAEFAGAVHILFGASL